MTYDDAIATAAAIRSGEVSAREVVEDAIARIDKHGATLNAVVAERFEQALAEVDAGLPDGPLHGVPTLVKDLGIQVAGLPLTRGSRLWAGDVQAVDSELVRRYRAAGMVMLGTTNSPELGKNASTEPVLHGPTRNPWSYSHSAGGSSGGAAAAVASGMVPVAHGNDGGGSLRIPASACGLFGLKPSRGRVTPYPVASNLAAPLPVNHVVSRSVRDSALLLDLSSAPLRGDALAAPRPSTPFAEQAVLSPARLRIGVVDRRADGGEVSPEVVAAVRRTAALCEELGHEVEETVLAYDHELLMRGFGDLMGVSLLADVTHRLAVLGRTLRDDDLEPFTRMLYDHYAATMTPVHVYDALAAVQRAGWQLGEMFGRFDLLLTPTLPLPVPELGYLDTSDPVAMWQRGGDYSSFTAVANATGMPAMSLPAGIDAAGLPVGAHFIGDLGAEGTLLALATQLEAARPWELLAPSYR
ncbi:amidase [Nocardioides sp. zg-536]|uniref:Amidase n=1 Tax=Nocardioides faecalis TaxID=2803858 RepID=A0A938Y6E6_9ACTN|nr:amidase family protein [Nocardioides faecalis]MBM9460115.1 amidase [Nocardioides faecalis]MBS4754214.1 amidase [Nocardioides faecalis]QVI60092.1 amidase [Nocardioides faecalis]